MFCLASNLEFNKESTRNSATNAYGKRGAIQNLLVTPKFEWYWLFQKWTYSKINFFSRKRTSNQFKSLQILSVKLDIWYSTVFRAHFNIKVSFYHLEDHSILFDFKPDLHNLGWCHQLGEIQCVEHLVRNIGVDLCLEFFSKTSFPLFTKCQFRNYLEGIKYTVHYKIQGSTISQSNFWWNYFW